MPFYLNILGVARLVIDPEELNHLPADIQKENNKDSLIICIRIQEASYYDITQRTTRGTIQRLKDSITSLFINDTNNYYFDVLE
jgi:hypothetical protein